MTTYFFVHRDDPSRRREISVNDAGEIVVVQIRGAQRASARSGMVDLEATIKDAALFGFVPAAGSPSFTPGVDLPKLERATRTDPYGAFEPLQDALSTGQQTQRILELLLSAITSIEADIDEHDSHTYNQYFPPTDEHKPTYEVLAQYRAHYERLVRITPTAADLTFRLG